MGFAEEGCNIVAVARSEELLNDVKNEALVKGAASFDYVVKDIMECDTKAFAKELISSHGVFDVVVHNVGGSFHLKRYCIRVTAVSNASFQIRDQLYIFRR